MSENVHLQHIRSSVNGKMPTADDILYGELSINYADSTEELFIKNNQNEIIGFKSHEFYEAIIEELRQQIEELSNRLDEVEETISNINTDITNITAELEKINNSITTINENITTINGDITTINNNIDNINGNINVIEGDITNINSDIDVVEGDIVNINADIDVINEDIVNINNEISSLKNKSNAIDIVYTCVLTKPKDGTRWTVKTQQCMDGISFTAIRTNESETHITLSKDYNKISSVTLFSAFGQVCATTVAPLTSTDFIGGRSEGSYWMHCGVAGTTVHLRCFASQDRNNDSWAAKDYLVTEIEIVAFGKVEYL